MEIIIDKKSYRFEDRLTIEQWQAVMKYDFTNPFNWPTIINIVTGVPKDLLVKGNQDTLELGAAIIVQMCNARMQTKIKPMDKLTFGEFVDLDSYLAMGTQEWLKAMAVILVDTQWADEALWAIDQWVNYRLYIFRQYSALFGLEDQDLGTDEESTDRPIQKDAVARNWYKIIVDLAGDDILRLDAVTEEPLIKVLNFLALRKEKQMEENMKIMEQNMKLKTQHR